MSLSGTPLSIRQLPISAYRRDHDHTLGPDDLRRALSSARSASLLTQSSASSRSPCRRRDGQRDFVGDHCRQPPPPAMTRAGKDRMVALADVHSLVPPVTTRTDQCSSLHTPSATHTTHVTSARRESRTTSCDSTLSIERPLSAPTRSMSRTQSRAHYRLSKKSQNFSRSSMKSSSTKKSLTNTPALRACAIEGRFEGGCLLAVTLENGEVMRGVVFGIEAHPVFGSVGALCDTSCSSQSKKRESRTVQADNVVVPESHQRCEPHYNAALRGTITDRPKVSNRTPKSLFSSSDRRQREKPRITRAAAAARRAKLSPNISCERLSLELNCELSRSRELPPFTYETHVVHTQPTNKKRQSPEDRPPSLASKRPCTVLDIVTVVNSHVQRRSHCQPGSRIQSPSTMATPAQAAPCVPHTSAAKSYTAACLRGQRYSKRSQLTNGYHSSRKRQFTGVPLHRRSEGDDCDSISSVCDQDRALPSHHGIFSLHDIKPPPPLPSTGCLSKASLLPPSDKNDVSHYSTAVSTLASSHVVPLSKAMQTTTSPTLPMTAASRSPSRQHLQPLSALLEASASFSRTTPAAPRSSHKGAQATPDNARRDASLSFAGLADVLMNTAPPTSEQQHSSSLEKACQRILLASSTPLAQLKKPSILDLDSISPPEGPHPEDDNQRSTSSSDNRSSVSVPDHHTKLFERLLLGETSAEHRRRMTSTSLRGSAKSHVDVYPSLRDHSSKRSHDRAFSRPSGAFDVHPDSCASTRRRRPRDHHDDHSDFSSHSNSRSPLFSPRDAAIGHREHALSTSIPSMATMPSTMLAAATSADRATVPPTKRRRRQYSTSVSSERGAGRDPMVAAAAELKRLRLHRATSMSPVSGAVSASSTPTTATGGSRRGGRRSSMSPSKGAAASGGKKIGGGGQRSRKRRDPNRVKAPVSAYHYFVAYWRPLLSKQIKRHPRDPDANSAFKTIARIIAQKWRASTPEDRVLTRCDELAEKDRKRYERAKAEKAAQFQKQEREKEKERLQAAAAAADSRQRRSPDLSATNTLASVAASLVSKRTHTRKVRSTLSSRSTSRSNSSDLASSPMSPHARLISPTATTAADSSTTTTHGNGPLFNLVHYLNQPISPRTPAAGASASVARGTSSPHSATQTPLSMPPNVALPPSLAALPPALVAAYSNSAYQQQQFLAAARAASGGGSSVSSPMVGAAVAAHTTAVQLAHTAAAMAAVAASPTPTSPSMLASALSAASLAAVAAQQYHSPSTGVAAAHRHHYRTRSQSVASSCSGSGGGGNRSRSASTHAQHATAGRGVTLAATAATRIDEESDAEMSDE